MTVLPVFSLRGVIVSTKEQNQVQAAQEFLTSSVQLLKTEQGLHVETAIVGLSRMAGTLLFRSFHFPLDEVQPGQLVLSEQANEQGQRLFELLRTVTEGLGIPVDVNQLGQNATEQHAPLFDFLETQPLLEPTFEVIRKEHDLSSEEGAEAAAIATAYLIHHCATVLDPAIAVELAMLGIVEGAKTAPDPVFIHDTILE